MAGSSIIPLSRNVYRWLCLLTAAANVMGNILLLLFYRPLFGWLGVPMPQDLASFAFVAGFSFTVGILALLVFLDPEKNASLLIVGIVGKGIYALFTFYFYVFGGLHWFYLVFGIWDAIYTVVFFLFLIQLLSPDLTRLNSGDIFAGLDRPRTNRALFFIFSLTNTGRSGMSHIQTGLERKGYQVDVVNLQAVEPFFRFPMSLRDFFRIVVRSIFRIPAHILTPQIPAGRDYDLILIESQTWLVGMSAPVEALFQRTDTRAIFRDCDVAILNVARGAWRRSQAMVVRWLEGCGANLVGARAFTHIGWEPSRLFSLWFYLIYRKAGRPKWLDGFVQKRYGISDSAYAQLEQFGEDLAGRKRVKWTHSTVI